MQSPSLPTTADTKQNLHLAWLDSLRGLAALYVVVHHIMVASLVGKYQDQTTLAKIVNLVFQNGHYAVGLFIVLSGFSLMIPVTRFGSLRGSVTDFYLRRARRILPPYYISLILSLIIDNFVRYPVENALYNPPATPYEFFMHLILLQDVFGNHRINYVYWSIAVEWRIYLIFPFLISLFKKLNIIWFGLCAICASAIIAVLLRDSVWLRTTPVFLALFCFGMIASEVAFSQKESIKLLREKKPWGVYCVVCLLVLSLAQFYFRKNHNETNEFLRDIIHGIFCALILITAAQNGSRLGSILSFKGLVFLGTYAYSIYLTHAPILAVIYVYVVHPLHLSNLLSFILMTVLCVPTVLGLAYLFFLACERPFLTKKQTKALP